MSFKDLPDYPINTKEDRATGIRIPRELHRKINDRAETEFRTFNSMIIALLTDQIKKPVSEEMFLRLYRKILDLEKKLKELTDSLGKG